MATTAGKASELIAELDSCARNFFADLVRRRDAAGGEVVVVPLEPNVSSNAPGLAELVRIAAAQAEAESVVGVVVIRWRALIAPFAAPVSHRGPRPPLPPQLWISPA